MAHLTLISALQVQLYSVPQRSDELQSKLWVACCGALELLSKTSSVTVLKVRCWKSKFVEKQRPDTK